MSVTIQAADFDCGQEIAAMTKGRDDIGALASFIGLVRADTLGTENIDSMQLEHYPGMTEKALAEIVAAAEKRWMLQSVRVIHRVGKLLPGEQIVLVLVAASHRGAAFAACEFIMDFLKTRAPFWKKEVSEHYGQWVEARDKDEMALQRWQDAEK
ncbi:MAG: molybdopterin synthase catalytic subunit MoaE [Rhodocyclales bacterium]|nr:molybdopterin synthase catalytic subunit MoaE [Rhodocyclales bacterium]